MENSETNESVLIPTQNIDNFTNIPEELKSCNQWVCWKLVQRDDKPTKIPLMPGGSAARSSDPLTWSSFRAALNWYIQNQCDGIGFVFSKDDPYAGVDLDACRDRETGKADDWAIDILDQLGSYSEVSQSEQGIHIIVKASLVENSEVLTGTRQKLPGTERTVEIYDRGRFFGTTGNRLDQYPADIHERQNEIMWLYRILNPVKPQQKQVKPIQQAQSIDDALIIQKASNAKNGDKFKRLLAGDWSEYPSASEADLAICSILAFYTQDVDQLLRIIQGSGLWDRKWEREDYQTRTIQKAIEGLSEVYNWHRGERHTPVIPSVEKPIQTFALTDQGNGERLAYHHGENIRYCYQTKAWYIWDSRRWCEDTAGEIYRLAKDTVRRIYHEAGDCADEEQRKAIGDHARKSESNFRQRAMIEMCQSEQGIPITQKLLDADPWRLNCLNGTIDLHTGELLPHTKDHLITKLVPVAYKHGAKFPLWDSFLKTVTKGNEGLIAFLQRAVGYSLTGDTGEEKLFFIHGPAASGKSTFIEAIKGILGDYAATADFETFLQRNYIGGVRDDIAELCGARLVTSVEVERGKRMAEGLVSLITGGDTIRARMLYQRGFNFIPQLKLWLVANHKPKVDSKNSAIWRRILLIPFEHVIPEADRDPQVKTTLKDPAIAGVAILSWAVGGCLRWQEYGLTVPDVVKKATDMYRQEMDVLQSFIDDCCVINADARVSKKELFQVYSDWCKESGEQSEGKINFGRRMKELNIEEYIGTDNIHFWRGIGLIAKAESQQN